jgi:hypothetical protein
MHLQRGSFCAKAMKIAAGTLGGCGGNLKQHLPKQYFFAGDVFLCGNP